MANKKRVSLIFILLLPVAVATATLLAQFISAQPRIEITYPGQATTILVPFDTPKQPMSVEVVDHTTGAVIMSFSSDGSLSSSGEIGLKVGGIYEIRAVDKPNAISEPSE